MFPERSLLLPVLPLCPQPVALADSLVICTTRAPEVRQDGEKHERHNKTRTQRCTHRHPSTGGSAATRVICGDLQAARPGFARQGICGANQSSITMLRCQKPSLGVTVLNLAKPKRQERKKG
ncbi:unnamed protein product [Pleuronectes platessa]|uniref:Secreted protein n=1 Tax=Pleuronectes platessa TaxID=8262 RepID=A0A9N7VYA5_PLEPL|nr:unnamed protein product [Pleuronectes platessa]